MTTPSTTAPCVYVWAVDDEQMVPSSQIHLNNPATPGVETYPDLVRPEYSAFVTMVGGSATFTFADITTPEDEVTLTILAAIRIQGDNLDTVEIKVMDENKQEVKLESNYEVKSDDYVLLQPLDIYSIEIVFLGMPTNGLQLFTGISIDLYGCFNSKCSL